MSGRQLIVLEDLLHSPISPFVQAFSGHENGDAPVSIEELRDGL
ncbi:MAG: hypothetical protein ACKVI3_10945 [Verrucomicrobiia bacterium]